MNNSSTETTKTLEATTETGAKTSRNPESKNSSSNDGSGSGSTEIAHKNGESSSTSGGGGGLPQQAPLSKKDRKFLKKLRKRAIGFQAGEAGARCDTSGITLAEDWTKIRRSGGLEYITQTCKHENPFVPVVRHRHNTTTTTKYDERSEQQRPKKLKIDAADHRDILRYLLTQQQQQQQQQPQPNNNNNSKRSRKQRDNEAAVPPSIPSWATLHNPACLQHVAVLEIYIDDDDDDDYIDVDNTKKKKDHISTNTTSWQSIVSRILPDMDNSNSDDDDKNNKNNNSRNNNNDDGSRKKDNNHLAFPKKRKRDDNNGNDNGNGNDNNNKNDDDNDDENDVDNKNGKNSTEGSIENNNYRAIFPGKRKRTNNILQLETRWFQGNYPRSISDALFYRNDPPSTNKNKKRAKQQQQREEKWTHQRQVLALQRMALTEKQQKREGYPTTEQLSVTAATTEEEEEQQQQHGGGQPMLVERENEEKNAATSTTSTSTADIMADDEEKPTNKKSGSGIQKAITIPERPPLPPEPAFRLPGSFSLEEAEAIVRGSSGLFIADNDDDNDNSGNNDGSRPKQQQQQPRRYIVSPSSQQHRDQHLHVPRILALDCEMVQTCIGAELARITLIRVLDPDSTLSEKEDQHQQPSGPKNNKNKKNKNTNNLSPPPSPLFRYEVLMDEWVLPQNPVLDYVTEYSGITAEIMNTASPSRIEQVQASLLSYVRPNDVLIGHSIENDLHSIGWIFRGSIVDTAIVFRRHNNSHGGGNKYSLRHLSAALLRKKIQDNTGGHCSEEDAVTALELAIRRSREGPGFMIRDKNHEKRWVHKLLLLRHNNNNNNNNDGDSDHNHPVFVGPAAWLQKHVTSQPCGFHALACETVRDPNAKKAVLAWLTGPKRKTDLVWTKLVVVDYKKKKTNSSSSSLDIVKEILSELRAKTTPGTLLLVAMQRGYSRAAAYSEKKRVCQDPRTTSEWSDEQEAERLKIVEECRCGPVFWIS